MLIDFDIKDKLKKLKHAGKKAPPKYFDLGVAFWLINPDEKEYTLEFLSKKYLNKERNLSASSGLKQLYKVVLKKLKEYKLEKLFFEVEMPLLRILADMELRGIKINLFSLKKLDKKLAHEIANLVKQIHGEAGEAFNINSPKQLSQVLFEKLKIASGGIRRTKTGAISTNVEALNLVKAKHPIIKFLLEYRELFKLQSTYVKPLQELVAEDGRVHTTYIQTGTATGRLSSQSPNLQNIPIGSEWATELRKAFIPEKNFKLVSFDYSQIELRILASLSGDPKMIDAFNNDLDIHKLTAANVFNVPIERVDSGMRRLAKTLNFGIVYGMGAATFSKTSGLSAPEARKFIEEYFSDFKRIKVWQEEVKSQARTLGYVTNPNGRRRWLLSAASVYRGEAAEAERAAINMPVQGLAADIIKMAMVRVAKDIKKKNQDGVRMLLTIHDELLFEIKGDIIKEASRAIVELMESVYELEVPLKVMVKTGKNWGKIN